MTITKSIASVFILLLFPIIIGLDVQAQPQSNRNTTRQVSNMLQRLERSSSRFRNSLNVELVQRSVDQTQPQNDISTFQAGFDLAIKQFRDQFTRRLAVASDVESILQNASPINSFITQNTLNPRVKNDWASVRTDLNTMASAYGVSWQWNQLTPVKVVAPETVQRAGIATAVGAVIGAIAGGGKGAAIGGIIGGAAGAGSVLFLAKTISSFRAARN